MTGFSLDGYAFVLNLAGTLIGMFFGICAMKAILTNHFNGYRLALIKADKNTSAIDA